MYTYKSIFSICIEKFLDFKVSLNFSRGSYDSVLKSLDYYAIEQNLCDPILSREVVEGIIPFHKKNITQNGQRARLIVIREFGKYLRFTGVDAYILEKNLIPKRQQYMPYLFSDAELNLLFTAMDNLPAKQNNSHLIIPVLFRMMYCCAMRPGEPLNLLREDVDLDNRIIHIKNTKRHANRIISINEDLFNLCRDFDSRMGQREWFFCTPDNKQLANYWSRFRDLYQGGIS